MEISPEKLCARLLSVKDSVIAEWEARVREEVASARHLPHLLLKDSLPRWIDRLAEAFAVPEVAFVIGKVSEPSRRHGRERAENHFDLNEVIYEYSILRQVLLDRLEREGPLPESHRDLVLDAIEFSVRQAVGEYTRKQRQFFQFEAHRGSKPRYWRRFLVSACIVAVFAFVQWLAWPVIQPLPYVLFYPAVTFAALYGSATFATILSLLASEALFAPAGTAFAMPTPQKLITMLLFTLTCLLISYITGALRRSRRLAITAFADQENARFQAERSLASLDAILASSPFGLCVLDRDLRYLRVNEPLAQMNGLSADEHIGKHVQEVLGEEGDVIERMLKQVLETGRPVSSFEISAFPPSDPMREHNYMLTFYPIRTPDDEILGVGAVVLDVTEQKAVEHALREQQERFDLALRAADIGVWELNLRTGDLKWTERHYTIFGLTPGEPIDLAKVYSLIHPDDLPRLREYMKDAERQESGRTIEFRIIRPDGQLRWIQGSGRVLKHAGGHMLMMGTNVDFTERKAAEIQREQFVSTLSHDLRTPLTAARMAAQLAARNAGNADKVLHNAAKVVDGLDRLDKMIRDLLDANRIRGGQRLPIHPAPAELGMVVRNAVDELAAIHGDRFRVGGDEVVGQWDRVALRRLVENLCTNAVKYGDSGAPIDIYIYDSGGEAELRVHNFGEPIPAGSRDKLFDYLHRANPAQSSGKMGWGIGLTLVRGVTEAHGGRVSVRSEKGEGTTFTVHLPKTCENRVNH